LSTSEETTEPTRPTRQEFVRALIEHSWARPDARRPVARPHIVLMVAAFAAAGAVAAGFVLQLIHPVHIPKPPAPPPAPAAPFTAVTGWDCYGGAAHYGFSAQGRTSAWYTVPRGGWTQGGCDGTFEAIPMTRSQASEADNGGDPNQIAVWWFTPTKAMTQCTVMVFRPVPQQPRDSAATVAQFYVLSGQNGPPLAGFVLDEAIDPGSWATVGTFPVSADGIAVELVSGAKPLIPGGRLAVGQVRVRCTG
jgi:hypothetical protein